MSQPLLLGIEIGGTKLQLGLGNGDGKILALRRLDIDPTHEAAGILAQIAATVGPLLDEFGAPPAALRAIGIGFGGPVDADRGIATKSHQVAGWDGFPLAAWAREHLGIPIVSIHNDADTAALGEARFGAGVGLSPVLYLTIGSGIGGGLIVDGRIYRGSGAGAMEIGHLIINPSQAPGGLWTLEDIASGWGIGRQGKVFVEALNQQEQSSELVLIAGRDSSRTTAAQVARAAILGDHYARMILSLATEAMGRGLAHAVTLLAPRRIILGGGVSLIGEELWFEPIRRELDRLVFPPFRGTYDVVPAALGEEVVVHGALALARDAWEAADPSLR